MCVVNVVAELEKVRNSISETIITSFDRIIEGLENPSSYKEPADYELKISLSADPSIFIGRKPAAVLFGEEHIGVKSWRDVYRVILTRCNEDPQCHENLMYLRNKTAGKVRVFLSDKPDGMTRPVMIDEGIYGEVQYGSQTLMHILVQRILEPAHFDYSDISIVIRTGNRL